MEREAKEQEKAQRLEEERNAAKKQREEEIEAEANRRVAAMLRDVQVPLSSLKISETDPSKVITSTPKRPAKPVTFVKEGTRVTSTATRPTFTVASTSKNTGTSERIKGHIKESI